MKIPRPCRTFPLNDCQGQNLVEFSMVTIMLIMLVFGVIEIGRMMLVYATISNAARIGTRYAIVNGSDTAGGNVTSVVNNYLAAGPVNTASATVVVAYPDTGSCHDPGCRVTVTITYPYIAMLSYYGFNVTLHNTSEGVITW